MDRLSRYRLVFFFNDTATTEIYTLSLHDALPICLDSADSGRRLPAHQCPVRRQLGTDADRGNAAGRAWVRRSEEHTSELQSHLNLVCRLLLEKKKSPRSKRNIGSSKPGGLRVSLD